jgi:hypothetical protein
MGPVNGGVDRLITFDVRDFQPAARNFGVVVQTPQALKEISIR